MSKRIILTLGLVLGLACTSYAANIYVAAGSGGGGTSWLDAYGSLDSALAVAASGDTVYVARGKYVPSGTTFTVPAGVTIKGGYSNYVVSYGVTTDIGEVYNPKNYPTVLSGDTNGDDAFCDLYEDPHALDAEPTRADNKATVMTLSGNATIDGLFFCSSGTTMNTTENGAIYCSAAATVTINNCEFYANVGNRAAALYATSSSGNFTVSNCNFLNNASYQAVVRCTSLNLTIAKCTFKGNSNGNGNSPGIRWNTAANGIFTLTDCLFVDQVSDFGTGCGSLYISGSGSPCTSNISRCVFRNDSTGWGGSGYFYNSGTTSVQTWNVTNCLWTGCREGTNNGIILIRPKAAGNISTLNMTNCTIADNISSGGATAGIKLYNGPALNNNSIVVNIKNTILWGNTGAQILWDTTTCNFTDTTYNPFKISYCCIDTVDPNNYPAINPISGIPTGLVVANPQFVGGGDYHLQSTSPCIDKGDPASSYANEPKWLNGCRVNMGAYGNTKEAATTTTCVALTADTNGDCRVNNADLLTLRGQWLKTCP